VIESCDETLARPQLDVFAIQKSARFLDGLSIAGCLNNLRAGELADEGGHIDAIIWQRFDGPGLPRAKLNRRYDSSVRTGMGARFGSRGQHLQERIVKYICQMRTQIIRS